MPGKAQVGKRLIAWLEMLQHQVDAGERSPTYLRELRRYARTGGESEYVALRSIHDVRRGDIEDWVGWLRDRGLGPTTVGHVVQSSRTFMRWLAQREELRSVPSFPSLKRTKHRPRLLSLDEQDQMLDAIPEDRRGIYLAMADVLIRPGEARALNVADYDWDRRELSVYAAMKGPNADAPRRGTKEDDERLLDVTGRLAAWLDEFVPRMARRNPALPLFLNRAAHREDHRFNHWALIEGRRTAVRTARLDAVGLYEGTKHSTATALIRSGVSLDVIQKACGHRDPRLEERYAKLANEQVRDALGRLRQL